MIDWVSNLPVYDYPLYGIAAIFLFSSLVAFGVLANSYSAVKTGIYDLHKDGFTIERKTEPISLWFNFIFFTLIGVIVSFTSAVFLFMFFIKIWKQYLN
jgi:hypothetical protein